MDPDGVVADSVKWTWHSSADGTDAAIAMATSDTYTPKETGPLSAKASYTDGEGTGKSASGAGADVVVNIANVAPKFASSETGMRKWLRERLRTWSSGPPLQPRTPPTRPTPY